MTPLNDQQRLFMVESEQLYGPWQQARLHLVSYKHGMAWKRVGGREYLYRLLDNVGNAKSQGVRSPETEAIFQAFQEGRERARERFNGLNDRVKNQARLNKAVRINRLPAPVSDVLRVLDQSKARDQFRIVGTHAIFAYEAIAGVQLRMDLLASGDVDLLYDPRKKLSISVKNLDGNGLLGLLRLADKSYVKIDGETFRAVNNSGFMVDLIVPAGDMRLLERVTFSADDLAAVEAPNLHWLTNAPAVDAIAIANDGLPVRMKVPDPRAFAVHKAWLSEQPEREPLKKPRDWNQAQMVFDMIKAYLPQYPMDESQMRFFPKRVLQAATNNVEPT